MKGELLLVNNELGFFVKKKDIETEIDKRAICEFIGCLYHTYASSWFTMEIEELDEILEKGKRYAYIGFKMNDDKHNPNVSFLGYTTKQFNQMKQLNGMLSNFQ